VRDHVRGLPSRGVPAKLQVLLIMLQIEPWSQLPLRLRFVSAEVAAAAAAFPRQPPPHVASRTTVGPIADMWMYVDAARLVAAARAAKAEERAAVRALKQAARARQRGARGGAGRAEAGDSPSASAGGSWQEVESGSRESSSSEGEGGNGGGGGGVQARRRSRLFRVRRVSEAAAAAAPDGDVEVIEISSDSEGEGRAAAAGDTRALPAGADDGAMGEVVEVVDDEEGVCGDLGDEGLDEEELSPSQSRAPVGEAELDMRSLTERLKRRLEAEAAGGGGGSGGGGPSARPAPAAAAGAEAASPPCARCAVPVAVTDPSGAWLQCSGCGATAHALCLADYVVQAQSEGGSSNALLARLVPTPAPVPCPARGCAQQLTWPLLVEEALQRGLASLEPAQLREALGLEAHAAPAHQKKKRQRRK
jgi:hypothetical protein